MASWNYTSDNPQDTFEGINTLTEGLFGVSILIIIWLVIWFRLRRENNRDSILAANFTASITAFFFGYINIVNDTVVGIAIVLFLGSLALLMTRPKQ